MAKPKTLNTQYNQLKKILINFRQCEHENTGVVRFWRKVDKINGGSFQRKAQRKAALWLCERHRSGRHPASVPVKFDSSPHNLARTIPPEWRFNPLKLLYKSSVYMKTGSRKTTLFCQGGVTSPDQSLRGWTISKHCWTNDCCQVTGSTWPITTCQKSQCIEGSCTKIQERSSPHLEPAVNCLKRKWVLHPVAASINVISQFREGGWIRFRAWRFYTIKKDNANCHRQDSADSNTDCTTSAGGCLKR